MSNSIIPSLKEFTTSQKAFIKTLRKPQFRVEKDVHSYRVIRSWEEFGILDNNRKNPGAWRKFSHVELVWLRIIKILRTYGVELEKILRVKKYIFENEKYMLDYRIWQSMNFGYDSRLIVLPDGSAFYEGENYTRSEVYLSINLTEIIKQEVKI